MNTQSLTAIGLTPLQTAAYALLIEQGEINPVAAAKQLETTRTNAYKIFDKLVELNLAQRIDRGKKIAYVANNPIALASLTEQYRAEATAREEAVNTMMQELLAKYHMYSDKPDVSISSGLQAVAAAYRKQLGLREDVYFIRTKADVAMMGFDTMHEIRTHPAKHGKHRKAIMSAENEQAGPINYTHHNRSNLEITWVKDTNYNAPVEWSVTESSLLIVLYATEPYAILITDKVVAGAFIQIWKLLSSLLQAEPLHKSLKPAK